MPTNRPKPPANKPNILAALRYRNYRLFFGGQSISLVGTWMQRIAMSWLVYKLGGANTHAAALIGWQGFLGQIPMFLFAPYAGVLIERWNKQRVLVWTQVLAMLQAFVLSALVLSHHIQIWHVFVLSPMLGIVNTFDMPTRQSFVIRMIEQKEDLPNAIALNSFMVNCGKLIGPGIAAAVIAAVGEGWCFFINGVSYIGVIFAIRAMRVSADAPSVVRPQLWRELRQGLSYVWHNVPIRSVMILLVVVSLVGVPYTDMLPIVAHNLLHGNEKTFGLLRASTAVGAIVGGLWLARRNSAAGLGRAVPMASALFGLGLVAFACSKVLPVSVALLCITGLGMMVQMASSNTIVQMTVDDDKRARVMSLYAMAMQGTLPWGSLIAGHVAASIGVPRTLMWGGALVVVAAALFMLGLSRWGPEHGHLTSRLEGVNAVDSDA